jgi:hypothetical protein
MNMSIDSGNLRSSNPMRAIFLAAPSVIDARRRDLLSLAAGSPEKADLSEGALLSLPSGQRVVVQLLDSAEKVMKATELRPVDAVLIDNRETSPIREFANTMAGRVIPLMLAHTLPVRGVSRHSILVILDDFEPTAHHAYAVGALQLGGVFVNPASLGPVLESACRLVSPLKPGKTALCLAGGGIEGFFY